MAYEYIIAACAGGFLWRLRGGALATFIGVHIGTNATRAAFDGALVVVLFLLSRNVVALYLFPGVFIGLAITGWGPFQGLGAPPPAGEAPEKSWMRLLPDLLGLKVGSVAHDTVGLIEAGLLCMAPNAALVGYIGSPAYGVLLWLVGVLFPLGYAIPRLVPLPSFPRFASGGVWGEFFCGAFVAPALLAALMAV